MPHIKSEPIIEAEIINVSVNKRKASPIKEMPGISNPSEHGAEVKRQKQHHVNIELLMCL
jgi:hypothetical protein